MRLNNWQEKIIVLQGAALGLVVLGIALAGMVQEFDAGQPVSDLARWLLFRTLVGLVFAVLIVSPWLLALAFARFTGFLRTLMIFATVLFLLNVAALYDAFVQSESSTAALVLVFLPLWGLALTAVVGGLLKLAQWLRRPRAPEPT